MLGDVSVWIKKNCFGTIFRKLWWLAAASYISMGVSEGEQEN